MEYNEFSDGKIYKIKSKNTDKIYIGSTCQSLNERLKGHEKDFIQYYNGNCNKHVSSFEILEFGDYKIKLIQDFSCDNKQQLKDREAYYIKENIKIVVNKCIPNRSSKQYKIDNKERLSDYNKQYNIDNKEKFMKPHLCECGQNYTYNHKSRHFKSKKHLNYISNSN